MILGDEALNLASIIMRKTSTFRIRPLFQDRRRGFRRRSFTNLTDSETETKPGMANFVPGSTDLSFSI